MKVSVSERIIALSASGEELNDSVQYLTECFRSMIKPGDGVLIYFPKERETEFGSLAGKAVRKCGGRPVFAGRNLRWKELLRLAFLSRASTILAPPLIIMGLSKLAAYEGVPLYFYNAIMAGYPCLDWMMDGIEKGLDCRIAGVFDPGTESAISGFSCGCSRGVHIRDDKYGVDIVEDSGCSVPLGQRGRIVVYPRNEPETRLVTSYFGRIQSQPCPCGNGAPKLVDIGFEESESASLLKISEELLYWNSILECSVIKSEMGLELEVICFRGEKMPKLPSCARLLVRAWEPEKDAPLDMTVKWENENLQY